jgi:hypothetical protein
MTNPYDKVSKRVAGPLHFSVSTISALLYGLCAFSVLPLIALPFIAVFDLSTAYFVIGGCLSDRYKNGLPNPKRFFLLHVVPGVLGYLLLPTVFLLEPMFWVFLVLWTQAYVTGAWAFFKLRE